MAEKKELYGYEEDDILTLEFDDGEEEECGILGVFDALGKEYIALNPLGTEDVYLYGYKEYEEDYELIEFHRYMIDLHKRYKALRRGSLKQLAAGRQMIAYGRFCGENRCVVVVNNSASAQAVQGDDDHA